MVLDGFFLIKSESILSEISFNNIITLTRLESLNDRRVLVCLLQKREYPFPLVPLVFKNSPLTRPLPLTYLPYCLLRLSG